MRGDSRGGADRVSSEKRVGIESLYLKKFYLEKGIFFSLDRIFPSDLSALKVDFP